MILRDEAREIYLEREELPAENEDVVEVELLSNDSTLAEAARKEGIVHDREDGEAT